MFADPLPPTLSLPSPSSSSPFLASPSPSTHVGISSPNRESEADRPQSFEHNLHVYSTLDDVSISYLVNFYLQLNGMKAPARRRELRRLLKFLQLSMRSTLGRQIRRTFRPKKSARGSIESAEQFVSIISYVIKDSQVSV